MNDTNNQVSMKEGTEGGLLMSFIAGGLIGAGVALLLAPQSGDKTRDDIIKLSKDVKDKVNLTHFINEEI